MHNQTDRDKIEKWEQGLPYILAAIMILVLMVFVVFRFDYYYDLNDDMLMKDIVSGSYTGVPDGHNIQMLYPISWFLSLFYHLAGQISWYGIFFMVCHFGCFYLIALRSQSFVRKWYEKVILVIVEGILILTFFLYELVFVQYTVTAGLLGVTAAFLLYTTDRNVSNQVFIRKNVVSILLVILAFQVRTEMLLLIFPMICVVGIWKWSEEEHVLARGSFVRYFTIIGAILLGMLLSKGAHMIAYGSNDWKVFNNLFDSRTELYDYQKIPSYEENKAFYDSIDLGKSEQRLFENYNYGIDPKIDEAVMTKVAEYARENRVAEEPFVQRVISSVKQYLKVVLFQRTDIPWNYLVLINYLLVIIVAVLGGQYACFWKLPFLFMVRSMLWLYIVYGNRAPIRITHTLYLVEFLILCGLLLQMSSKLQKRCLWIMVFLGIFALRYAPSGLQYVQTEYDRREEVNQEYLSLRSYCSAHTEGVYFLDVYSTVAYSEKIFAGENNAFDNYEYLGGWACMSPCNVQKLQAFGMNTIEEGICEQDHVYVVSHAKREIDWLEEYLAERGYDKTVEKVDEVRTNGQISFNIYQVEGGSK